MSTECKSNRINRVSESRRTDDAGYRYGHGVFVECVSQGDIDWYILEYHDSILSWNFRIIAECRGAECDAIALITHSLESDDEFYG